MSRTSALTRTTSTAAAPTSLRTRARMFGAILAGKMIGLVLAVSAGIMIMRYFDASAFAETLKSAAPSTPSAINPLNTAWVLIAAFLVFFMQAGFMALETGMVRTRETVNVLLECIVDTALCGLLFYAIGFAFMFGSGNGFIGHQYFFLHGAPATYGTTGVSFLAIFLFQFAFADTASTITSGAMVGRTRFSGDLLYSIGVSGFIYPILGHWIWGPDGWLATRSLPMRDFAGSTVVHTVGGVIALVGAIMLGPRIGRKFKRDGGGPMPAHNMTLAALGAVILWFGWYGFNPGSTLSAMDAAGIGRVATNTTLAACSGTLLAIAYAKRRLQTWDTAASINGMLAGLVAITCPCYWVSPAGAILIGAGAGIVVMVALDLMEWFRIDDPVGAFAVHGAAGIWGTLALGLFATGSFGVPTPTGADTSTVVRGLFYGGGWSQLKMQAIGSLAVTSAALVFSFALFGAVKYIRLLRVSAADEQLGLDLAEHGTLAYPELPDGTLVPSLALMLEVQQEDDLDGLEPAYVR